MDDSHDEPYAEMFASLLRREAYVNMSPAIVGATAGVVALATVATCLRAYVRRLILRQWGKDDWAAMLSYFLVLATGVLISLSTRYGIGKPLSTVSPSNHAITSNLSKASILTYQAAVTSLKATFLLQYRRVFPLPNFQRACDVLFWFNLLFGISQILSVAIRCSNPASAWQAGRPGGPCINMLAWWYVNAAINLLTDLIILAMPIPMLRSLPLALKPKLALASVFGLGIFTTAITIVRITSLRHAATARDDTYGASLSAIFAIVELCCATVCVCVPTLRPLVGSGRRHTTSLGRGSKSSASDVCHGDSATDANSERIRRACSPRGADKAWNQASERAEPVREVGGHVVRKEPSRAWTLGTESDEEEEEEGGGDEGMATALRPAPRGSGLASAAEMGMRSMWIEDSLELER